MTAPKEESAASDGEAAAPEDVARRILVSGARAVAHGRDLRSVLQTLIGPIAEASRAESAAIVVRGGDGALEIAVSFGLDAAARAALTAACRSPDHPIARTLVTPTATFDVLPTRPGGPALRSHLPLTVTKAGTDVVLGVLAFAHEGPVDPQTQPVLLAAADLAAVAIERFGTG